MNSVGAQSDLALVAVGAVFHTELVQMLHKVGEGGNAKREMHFDFRLSRFFGASDDMQLLVRADAKPNVFPVLEWVGDSFESEDLLVKGCALVEIAHQNRGVVECHIRLG